MLGPAPIKFQFIVQYQDHNGWREFVQCNDFDRSVEMADRIAHSEYCMTRVVDQLNDRIIVHERVGPQPEYADDWYDPPEPEQVDWTKDGF